MSMAGWSPSKANKQGKGKKGQWGKGAAAAEAWYFDDDWTSSKGWGKGGVSRAPAEETQQQESSGTNRIWARYQFAKAILRASAGPGGACFQMPYSQQESSKNRKMTDDALLASDCLKKLLTTDSSHLLRRPAIGLSEICGSTTAGLEVLDNLDEAGWPQLKTLLDDAAVVDAFRTLNTEGTKALTAEEAEEAFKTVASFIEEKQEELEDALVKMTVAAGRTYLMGTSLLQLLTALDSPDWWADAIPATTSDSPFFGKWQNKPRDKQRMAKAIGVLMEEKGQRESQTWDNSASGIFGRSPQKASKRRPENDEEEAAAEDKKAKKASKKKNKKSSKKKNKKSTSSSSSSSNSDDDKKKDKNDEKDDGKDGKKDNKKDEKKDENKKDEKKKDDKKGAKKEDKKDDKKRGSDAKDDKKEAKVAKKDDGAAPKADGSGVQDDKDVAMTTWSLGDVQEFLGEAAAMADSVGGTDGGSAPTAELVALASKVPPAIMEQEPDLQKSLEDLQKNDETSSANALSFLRMLVKMSEEAERWHASGNSKSSSAAAK